MPGKVKENLVSPNREKGRPSWRPPDLKVVEQLAKEGATLNQIALSLGINPATLFRKKRQSKEFCDAINRGRAKGTLAISNALLERVKAGNVGATIRLLKKLGRNKTDIAACPDPRYVADIRKKKSRKRLRLLSQYITDEEVNRINKLKTLVKQRKENARTRDQTDIGGGWEKVRDTSCQDHQAAKPGGRRTGRPAWSPPEPKVVQSLAERGLSLAQIALCQKINRTTLFRRMKTDEDFAEAIATGRARLRIFAAAKLFEQAQKGKLRAIIFFLKAGWGEGHVEHLHGLGCIPVEQREKSMAGLRLLTTWEARAYLDIIRKAEQRMKEAGAWIPDDGLDEWGNVTKPPS